MENEENEENEEDEKDEENEENEESEESEESVGKRGKIRRNEETKNIRFPRFSLGGRCFYCCLTSFRSASSTAVSFSSLGASLRFHATMNRVVAAVGV